MERNVCVAALPRRAETFSGFDQKEKGRHAHIHIHMHTHMVLYFIISSGETSRGGDKLCPFSS